MSKTVSYFMIILYQIIEYHGSPVHIIWYDPVSYQTLYHINIIIIILYRPPTGEPKQLETPTAQAAASISVFRDSFWNKRIVDYSIMYDQINVLYNIHNDNIRCIREGTFLLGGGGGGAFPKSWPSALDQQKKHDPSQKYHLKMSDPPLPSPPLNPFWYYWSLLTGCLYV